MEPAMRRHSEADQRLPPGHVPAGKKDVTCFQMPLHYPSYTKAEYEMMPEWKLDRLLAEYGLPAAGDVAQKRNFAIGAFLWASRE